MLLTAMSLAAALGGVYAGLTGFLRNRLRYHEQKKLTAEVALMRRLRFEHESLVKEGANPSEIQALIFELERDFLEKSQYKGSRRMAKPPGS